MRFAKKIRTFKKVEGFELISGKRMKTKDLLLSF